MKRKIDIDLWSEIEAKLGQPEYVQKLARFYVRQGLSGDNLIRFVIRENCDHNKGDKFDHRGIFMDSVPDEIADSFGAETRSGANTFLAKAHELPVRTANKSTLRRLAWLCVTRRSFLRRKRMK